MSKNKNRIPYQGTQVSVEKSKAAIDTLLEKYNVQDVIWASRRGEFLVLGFVIEKADRGTHRHIPIRIKLPLLVRHYRDGRSNPDVPQPKATYRLLFYFIKAKLEAVESGLETIEESFMPHIVVDGKRTLKDVYLNQLPAVNNSRQLMMGEYGGETDG